MRVKLTETPKTHEMSCQLMSISRNENIFIPKRVKVIKRYGVSRINVYVIALKELLTVKSNQIIGVTLA
jgi:hypothetical protein